MPQQKPRSGTNRWKRRKARYMKGFSSWAGQHQSTKRLARREGRRRKLENA